MLVNLMPSFITSPAMSHLFLVTDLCHGLAFAQCRHSRRTCLRSQIESKVAASGQSVLNQQRDLIGKAELNRFGESSGFAEIDEVFEGECQGDGFGELDFDVEFRLFNIVVASKCNRSVTDITSARELDTVLGCFD